MTEQAKPASSQGKKPEPKDKDPDPEEILKDEEDAQEEEKMAIDQFYPEGYVDKVLPDTMISKRNYDFYAVMGMQSYKRYNLHFLEDDVIIFTVGNKYRIYNLTTRESQTFHGLDQDGVGSIAVHKTRKYFAVADKGPQPNIYIYEYPSMKLYRILKLGTEMMYAHCEFSTSGDKLVSLGGAPDYTLTVWDWINQRVILKAKAFSQEIFKASFSPYTDDILFTAGSGHIRFWKMAQTFTGLKLQGEIAKFGQLELSDVSGYYELPDGKVVSGTEYGTMTLWEGNLVKAHLVLDVEKKTPLHKGAIEVILFENNHFITAGTDGYIKWWPLADIDNAEADEIAEVAIAPTKTVYVGTSGGENAHIINMVKGNNMWLIQDARGRIWQLDCQDFSSEIILDFHSGAITDMAISDACNLAVTVGEDGNIKAWDYVRQKALCQRKFKGKAMCVDLLRRSEGNKGRIGIVGYDSGIVRVIVLTDTAIELGKVLKAHDSPVIAAKFAPSQTMLVTASQDGELFFFEVNGHSDLGQYDPLCLIKLPEGAVINDLKWDGKSSKIIVACKNGYVYELEKPVASQINNSESYLVEDYPIKAWKIKMMEFQMKKNQKKDEEEEERKRRMRLRGELPKEEEEEEEDWDPEPIRSVCYHNDDSGRFLIGSQGLYSGYYYLCDFEQERPVQAIEMPKDAHISFMQYSNFNDLLIIGFTNGDIRISSVLANKNYISIKQHDGHTGGITAAKLSFDDRMLVSTGEDGLIFVHTLDKYMIQNEAAFDPLADIEGTDYMPEDQIREITESQTQKFHEENQPNLPEIDTEQDGLTDDMFAVSLKIKTDDVQDIVDESMYSIQQAKLRTEEDRRLELAEEKKEAVKAKIQILRKQFKTLQERNDDAEEVIRVSEDDFNIDPEYFEMLLGRNDDKIEETKKEVAWNIEWHTVRLNKLKNKFYDVLDFEKFTVKAMRTNSYVTTFRVPKMSTFLQNSIEQFKALLENEIAAKEAIEYEDEEMLQNLDDKDEGEKKVKETKIKTTPGLPSNNANKTEAELKREQRKIVREQRKKQIEELLKKEAMHSGEDAEEKKKIEHAKKTFGKKDLKMSVDYEVPESQQVSYNKKRQQMVLLEGSIHKLKVDFNTKITELKVRKKEIIAHVENLYSRLREINTELGTPEELVLPQIDESVEHPQKFFDIDDDEIEKYKDVKKQRELDAIAAKKGATKNKKKAAQEQAEKEKEAERKANEEAAQKEADNKKKKHVDDNVEPHKRQVVERKNRKFQETELDDEMKMIRQIELQYEKDHLKDEVNTLINNFDEEIKENQKEKYRLESDLKNADLKLILLCEELILLKSMEHKDQELTRQLAACRQEKGLILKQINDITKSLKEKQKEIDRITESEENLKAKFHELCPEGSEKYDEIRKFFEKITKKRRKVEKVEKEDGDDDDEEDAVEEEDYEEDEEDEDDDTNIVGLSQEEYKIDEIEKLKDERLELYEDKTKISCAISELEKTRKTLATQETKINGELMETEEEIGDFQKEKMAKLNQLDVSVVLKIKQIQNLIQDPDRVQHWCNIRQEEFNRKMQLMDENQMDHDEQDRQAQYDELIRKATEEEDWRGYYLPPQLGECVLFTRTQLLQLIDRKRELDEEIDRLGREQDEARATAFQKQKEIKENKKQMAEKEREYKERQMLRFGNLVDLDSLEVSGPSAIVLELKNKFAKTEQRCIKEIEDAESKFQSTQRELTSCIQQNTGLLNLIRNLGENQLELNRQLDSTNKAIFVDEDDEDKRKMEQMKEHYKQKLEMQSKEIDILKTEINLYKRKGGHIYTKVTTNRRVANHLQDQ